MGSAGVIADEFFERLPAEAAPGAEVKLVRFPVEMDGEAWEGTDPIEFARTVKERKGGPKTAAYREVDIEKAARELAEAGKDPVIVTMSAGLSAPSTENAQKVASNPELRLKIVDSRLTLAATGLVQLAAVRAAKEGKSQDEVVRIAEEAVKRTNWLGAIRDLMYLYRGGRIGAAKALMGTLFKTLPIIEVRSENAVITPLGRVRKASDANERMVEQAGREIEKLGGKEVRVFVEHAGNEEPAKALAELASSKLPVVELFTGATSVAGVVHIGPGAWGMGYEVVV